MKTLFFFSVFFSTFALSQTNKDSLWKVWNDPHQSDNNKIQALDNLSWDGYLFTQPDSAFYTAQLLFDFAKEKGRKINMADALNVQAVSFSMRNNYDKSLEYHRMSLKLKREIGDKKGIAGSLNNMGFIYRKKGDYSRAIEYFTKSLGIKESIGDKKGIVNSYNNIANLYFDQKDFDKAVEYNFKSLKISKEINFKGGILGSYNSIGVYYQDMADYKKAIKYFEKCLEMNEGTGNKSLDGLLLNNLGSSNIQLGSYSKGLKYLNESLLTYEECGNEAGSVSTLINFGLYYYKKKGDLWKAKEYCEKAFRIAKENNNQLGIVDATDLLWKLNKDLGFSNESLELYQIFVATRDSIESEKNHKSIVHQEYKYAYEKQIVADSIKAADATKINNALLSAEKAKNKQHQFEQYFLYIGLVLAILFGGLIYSRFKLVKRSKSIIEHQKRKISNAFSELEKVHFEITASIDYAEYIQRNFLASTEILNENLKDYFILFKPRDVVSGDFYWAGKLANGKFAIVNADSTGHGVPGAIMSILNISSIELAIREKLVKPADIFNDCRKTIIERLKSDEKEGVGGEGMDASIICFDFENNKFEYTAAKNSIWIIRDKDLIEIKPEKMPIGKYINDHIPFIGGEFQMEKGDIIYTLTDGFQDQFGGPKGKKFMSKRLKEALMSISHLTLNEQQQKLSDILEEWQGDNQQVDDICVIGMSVT